MPFRFEHEAAEKSFTWTVVDRVHRVVDPVEEYLEHLRMMGTSANSVKIEAFRLALWWSFVEERSLDWTAVGVPEVAEWSRRSGIFPGTGRPELGPIAASTVETRFKSAMGFYAFHANVHGVEVRGRLHRQSRRRARGYRSFLGHTNRRSGIVSLVKVRAGRPARTPVFSARQLTDLLEACARRTPSGGWDGSVRDRRCARP